MCGKRVLLAVSGVPWGGILEGWREEGWERANDASLGTDVEDTSLIHRDLPPGVADRLVVLERPPFSPRPFAFDVPLCSCSSQVCCNCLQKCSPPSPHQEFVVISDGDGVAYKALGAE